MSLRNYFLDRANEKEKEKEKKEKEENPALRDTKFINLGGTVYCNTGIIIPFDDKQKDKKEDDGKHN